MVQRGNLAIVDEGLRKQIIRHTCNVCGKRWVVETLARDCETKHDSHESVGA